MDFGCGPPHPLRTKKLVSKIITSSPTWGLLECVCLYLHLYLYLCVYLLVLSELCGWIINQSGGCVAVQWQACTQLDQGGRLWCIVHVSPYFSSIFIFIVHLYPYFFCIFIFIVHVSPYLFCIFIFIVYLFFCKQKYLFFVFHLYHLRFSIFLLYFHLSSNPILKSKSAVPC